MRLRRVPSLDKSTKHKVGGLIHNSPSKRKKIWSINYETDLMECLNSIERKEVYINNNKPLGQYCYSEKYPQMTNDPIDRTTRFVPRDVTTIAEKLLTYGLFHN